MHDIEEGVGSLCLNSPPPKKRLNKTEVARRFEWLELGVDGACAAGGVSYGGVYVCDDPDPDPAPQALGNDGCSNSNDDDDIVLPSTEE